MEFQDQVVLVTGGSKGIGKAVAMLAAKRGAAVIIVGRSLGALNDTADEIRAATGARLVTVAGDVADADTAIRAVAQARDHFGRLDVVANIAGAFPTALLEDTTEADFAETIDINLKGTFLMCREALPYLRQQGWGAIVNMSSTAARFPTPGLSVYGASKAGVEAFTRAIANEAAPHIRVNAVSAGPTMTETVAALMAVDQTGAVDAVTKSLPLARLADPDEIAEAVLFLASSRASFITGQILQANGGGIMA